MMTAPTDPELSSGSGKTATAVVASSQVGWPSESTRHALHLLHCTGLPLRHLQTPQALAAVSAPSHCASHRVASVGGGQARFVHLATPLLQEHVLQPSK
jgi:hypothetical protein